MKAATAATLKKLYGDLSGATTDAKREESLAVMIQDEDFQQMLLNDPVDIHPVFISSSDGIELGADTSQF